MDLYQFIFGMNAQPGSTYRFIKPKSQRQKRQALRRGRVGGNRGQFAERE